MRACVTRVVVLAQVVCYWHADSGTRSPATLRPVSTTALPLPPSCLPVCSSHRSTHVGSDAEHPALCERGAPVVRELGFAPPPPPPADKELAAAAAASQ